MIGLNRTRGLAALRECVSDANDEVKVELDLLEFRLRDHLQRVRRFGYDSSSHVKQAEIDEALNMFARKNCGISFIELCDGKPF